MKPRSKLSAVKKMVIVLYVLILAVMASATFVENRWGTDVAHADIYGSWWFVLLWTLLAAFGLFYLLKSGVRHPGTIAIHVSLLIILLGALLTHLTSRQGMLHLREGRITDAYVIPDAELGMKSVKLPFKVKLNHFETQYHAGTQAAADYMSRFTVIDGAKRLPARVSMNKIFTYRSFRFYQASFDEDGHGSTLSVNTDPWGIPVTYTGYALLFLSLLWMLVDPRGSFRRLLQSPLLRKGTLLVLFLLLLSPQAKAQTALPRETADKFGHLFLLYNDRICPVETFALDFCKKVYGARSYHGLTANQVLSGWIFYGDEWNVAPFIKIKRGPLKKTLDLPDHCSVAFFFPPSENPDMSYRLGPYIQEYYNGRHEKLYSQAAAIDDKLQLIMNLRQGVLLKVLPYTFPKNVRATKTEPAIKAGTTVWFAPTDRLPAAVEAQHAQYIKNVFSLINADVREGHWGRVNAFFDKMYLYQQVSAGASLPSPSKTRAELLYNAIPFATILFMVNLLLGVLALICFIYALTHRDKPSTPSSIKVRRLVHFAFPSLSILLLLSFLALTLALILRWIVSGTIPMSNGYETMLVVAWFVQLISLLLCRRFRIVLVFGFLLSGFFLLISHIGAMDPAIGRIMPVLNSPLLSLHVGVIMMSYALLAFTFICGIMGLLMPSQAGHLQLLSRIFLYPAITTLGIGVFLGAIWANVSWGSYWSWDPKETWALITFMIYAVPLHSRSLPNIARPFGYHLYMVIAFLSIIMTYFGVNYFLSGMHSYA